jgi:uncharacterized protein (TIRG00374 family)
MWLVAAVLMATLLYWGRHDLGRIRNLDPLLVAVCFGCTAGMAVTSALKCKLSLSSIGESDATHFGSLLYYFMCGRAVGLVLPMDVSDFGVRTMSLKFDHSVSIGRASYSVYLDRTFDVIIAGVFLIPSVLFLVHAVSPRTGLILFGIAFVSGLVCFTFLARQSTRLLAFIFHALFKAVCRIPWIGKRVEFETESKLLEGGDFAAIAPALYMLSSIKFFFTAMRFVVIAMAVGMALGFKEILLFVPGAQFAALFALTPGGLGIADWSWSGLLYTIGADKHMIVPYLVSLRIVIMASIVVLAGISRLLYRSPRTVGDQAADEKKVGE